MLICKTRQWRNVKKWHFLRATRGPLNPNLEVVITHSSHQHSFGPPLRMYGMHRAHFDHARLDFLSLVIWSSVFWPPVTLNLRKAQRWSKSVLTFDPCRPQSVTFGCYQSIQLFQFVVMKGASAQSVAPYMEIGNLRMRPSVCVHRLWG